MTYQETMDYIHSLQRFGSKPGLQRIGALLARLGDPQRQLKFVHIAGTNGKGSTAAMTASVLRQAGYNVGLYISPYVVDFRERMQYNGQMVPPDELCRAVEPVRRAAEELAGDPPTEFEVITAAAFLWFVRRRCDIVVLEVGLGGRFDATNIIPPPLAAVITAIDLDHTQILGDTVEAIAAEKCGIIKPGTPVVSYPDQHPGALAVIMEHCAQNGSTLHMGNLRGVQVHSSDLSGSRVAVDGRELWIPLVGRHQIANCLTVLSVLEVLRARGWNIPPQAVEQGIAATRFPARLEILRQRPLVLLDGAHNPAGAAVLAQALQMLGGRPLTAVCGMLADKDWHTAVGLVAPHCSRLIAVEPANPRALDPAILAAEADLYCPTHICRSLPEAWALAQSYGDAVLIWGSLYLAADLRAIVLDGGPAQ